MASSWFLIGGFKVVAHFCHSYPVSGMYCLGKTAFMVDGCLSQRHGKNIVCRSWMVNYIPYCSCFYRVSQDENTDVSMTVSFVFVLTFITQFSKWNLVFVSLCTICRCIHTHTHTNHVFASILKVVFTISAYLIWFFFFSAFINFQQITI